MATLESAPSLSLTVLDMPAESNRIHSPPSRDDATYAVFLAGGLAVSLGAGLWLGALQRGVGAHALLQALGFIALVLAGMALRLAARLAQRRPVPSPVALAVFVLLFAGCLGWAAGAGAGRALFAAGALLEAGCLFYLLLPPPARFAGWYPGLLAGAGWWAALAVLAALGREREAELAAVFGVGAGGAFAVQSRMVTVFFGRRPTSIPVMVAGLLPFHGGLVAILLGASWGGPLAGIGLAWLAAFTGATAGRASGLTVTSAGAAVALRIAGLLAFFTAGLLIWARFSGVYLDAALHVTALGFLSVLLVGMAELLLPPFGLERTAPPRLRPERLSPWLLAISAVMRGLWAGFPLPAWWLAVAGSAAWLGLALFAFALVRAALRGPALREAVRAGARGGRG